MLPPDDVLVAHLTLLGVVGWKQDWVGTYDRKDAEWSLWLDGCEVWWNAGRLAVETHLMERAQDAFPQDTFPLVPLDDFPRPLLRKLATKLLERSDGS
ncbi:hypothetical protein [Burkholderia sp. BE12]|uniref:hypothetical protein n=1 Tax=Burkholderia sp. BE12 TaxID=2082394 RepID=UPI000CF3F723|nr:hypothetical protein [Burkholderia sp. BE12]